MNSVVHSVRPRTILLVEDDELVRDAMMRILVREGYQVLTAPTGHDAIGLLRTPLSPIDLVLLDIGLPDISGIDLCARLRELFPAMPVVVVTGAAGPDEAAELRRLGITRFFCKPIAIDQLVAALHATFAEGP